MSKLKSHRAMVVLQVQRSRPRNASRHLKEIKIVSTDKRDVSGVGNRQATWRCWSVSPSPWVTTISSRSRPWTEGTQGQYLQLLV